MLYEMRHRVSLCTQKDVMQEGTQLIKREGVITTWARIVPMRAYTLSVYGKSVDDLLSRSHFITIRKRTDIEISNLAWLYEERRKSPPVWYKVLSFQDMFDNSDWYTRFDARLDEQSDDSTNPFSEEACGPAMPFKGRL